jgi:hypothetical protein
MTLNYRNALTAEVWKSVESMQDSPEARFQSRIAFYKKYGHGRGGPLEKYGFGDSEIAFMRWEKRSVLKPLDANPAGSAWWSADNPTTTDGYERFRNQYFRANVRPTDHYTLSVPNREKYRLKTDESGFENLWLCGDWIDFGANVGYIDGAIQSGLQAAKALRKKIGSVGKTK